MVPTANAVPAPASGSSLRTDPIVGPPGLALQEIIHIARHTDQPATWMNSQILFCIGYPYSPGGDHGRRNEGQPVGAPEPHPNGGKTALQISGGIRSLRIGCTVTEGGPELGNSIVCRCVRRPHDDKWC
jgi:hypothetical protein